MYQLVLLVLAAVLCPNKLTTGPKEYSKFCFLDSLNVPEAKQRGTLRPRGNKRAYFSFTWGQSLSALL